MARDEQASETSKNKWHIHTNTCNCIQKTEREKIAKILKAKSLS